MLAELLEVELQAAWWNCSGEGTAGPVGRRRFRVNKCVSSVSWLQDHVSLRQQELQHG